MSAGFSVSTKINMPAADLFELFPDKRNSNTGKKILSGMNISAESRVKSEP